ncbi:CoA-transferase [Shewanella sp. NFH-SH190041]|uniref:CoA-transferase subunit beta n=1 Tax=Shewanella sp. NFH-SH190041 TaxID=2950245 RepID=UPI0021C2B946|nr:ketoacid CoA transferase [Shewanella sp. NFH-SH190041]BDM64291.1 CoA-transferase [Shewanella sp. NFH-SH190041]
MQATEQYTLAELMICAASRAFADDGEVLATGIGVIPRLAASLAMKTVNPDLMMTDSEAYLLSEPNPLGPREDDFVQANETWMGFSRIFDNVWSGRRHAMVGPTQIDRFGQANISALGSDYQRPKVQMLGVRGFPGNSISHANSFFVPSHNPRVFVSGECDMVASVGFNPARLPKGYSTDDIDIRLVITDLCVMDWQGPEHQLRLVSLHPGVSVDTVIAQTGFALHIPDDVPLTPAPTAAQLAIIRQLDPHNLRGAQLKDNPPGDRRTSAAESVQ